MFVRLQIIYVHPFNKGYRTEPARLDLQRLLMECQKKYSDLTDTELVPEIETVSPVWHTEHVVAVISHHGFESHGRFLHACVLSTRIVLRRHYGSTRITTRLQEFSQEDQAA
jgi:hypothetical protein